MLSRAFAFWAVMVIAGVATILLLAAAPEQAAWMRLAGGLLVLGGGAALLHESRATGARRNQVFAIAMMVYGGSQFIPAIEVRALLMIPVLLAILAALAVARRPAP